jgi:hypothetical protein
MFPQTARNAILFFNPKGTGTMMQPVFLTLWQVNRPEEAKKIQLLGDEKVVAQFSEWAARTIMFAGTISKTDTVDPNQVSLFANAALYAPGDREHPGGS